MLALTMINLCTLILPYFIINIWTMVTATKLNMKSDRFKQWSQQYKVIQSLIIIITGDSYVSLLLFTSIYLELVI